MKQSTHTFRIITREARDAAGKLHNRMPAFLEQSFLDRGLSPWKVTDEDQQLDEFDATSAKMATTSTTRPVSHAVKIAKPLDRTDASMNEEVAL